MALISDPVSAISELVSNVGGKLIDRIFPDKTAQASQIASAQLALYQLQADTDLSSQKEQLSAILAEAQSADPWTSRARPSFMYVIYLMILMSIPMGFLAAYNPLIATNVILGMKQWLAAIPDSLYTLFGVGYLGYTTAHSYDKAVIAKTGS